uniref:Obscurin like cytoskeletal adaptor 1 n=1 Tax=Catharus ustulatus TaxID=91951 RepID=A0A8C3TMQ6_CATUS
MEGFGGAPRFLAYPRAFTVQSGTNVVLSCQIVGDPQPSILWEKDKNTIEPSGRFHMESKGDLYSLLVSCATPKDSGLYVCRAKNSVGETYAATALRVEPAEPREEEGCSGSVAPAFLIAPSSMRVCRGEDVMFTCRVSGQPCPVLEWEKDGHKLSDLFESSHFSVGQKPEDWHFLKLFSARPQDGGVYVCRARSGSQEALAAAVLLVEPQAFAVSAGKHAKFRCYVTGKPKPEIIWQKDGEPLGYFILKVLYCKPQDQGLYVCTASNTAGQTLSAVQLQVKGRNISKECQRWPGSGELKEFCLSGVCLCGNSGGIPLSPQAVPWFSLLWGMCLLRQCPSHTGQGREQRRPKGLVLFVSWEPLERRADSRCWTPHALSSCLFLWQSTGCGSRCSWQTWK